MSEVGERVLAGDVRAVARACRAVDDRLPGYQELLSELYPNTGRAWLIGITGNPGAGKSTLTDRLITRLRGEGKRVAVVAVDPTSPFSGGAILGDRIRMQRHFEDDQVFIRSLATRGALGGLSRSAADVTRVLDAWGADVVLIETVGVGQDELEVTRLAHSTLVVASPGLGDDIQAIKAGILEIADVFCVNKADREGADATVRDLEVMLALGGEIFTKAAVASPGHTAASVAPRAERKAGGPWVPPVLQCIASKDRGVDEVLAALVSHRAWLSDTPEGQARARDRARQALIAFMRDALAVRIVHALREELDDLVKRVEARELDPYAACELLLERLSARS
ncbi:MAG: methylmalonyl Co-A mutase-associated GTPase MeaB [Polyangiaceae bacterium]